MRLKIILLLGFVSMTVRGADVPSVFNTNRTMRTLSLDECIRLALEHNLRIQIIRFDPNISRFQLEASRGIYDPAFSARYTHSYRVREGQFDENTGLSGRPSTTDSDTFAPMIDGVLPTGLKYALSGDLTHSSGTQGGGSSVDDYITGAGFQLEQPLLRNNFLVNDGQTTIQINKRNYQISELALEEEIRAVIRDVQLAYFEVLFSLEDVKVQIKALELANKLASDNRQKVAAGVMAEIDAKQAEAQAATSLSDLIQAQRRVLGVENTLKNLITDDYQNWHKTGIEPTEKLVAVPERLDLSESWVSALNKRPDWKQLGLEAEKLKLTLKLRSNQRLPDLNVFGGYGRGGVDSSTRAIPAFTNLATIPPTITPGTPAHTANLRDSLGDISSRVSPRWNVGIGVRIPLNNKLEQNRYRAAQEDEKQIEVQLHKLRQDIIVDVDNAMDSVRASYEDVSATHQARLFAEIALDAGQKRLDAGKFTDFEVLSLQKDLTTARSKEARALANYNEALALLFYRDGTVLERNKIKVQFK